MFLRLHLDENPSYKLHNTNNYIAFLFMPCMVEITENYYLMVGKSFEVKSYAELNSKLEHFNLISNLADEGGGRYSVRRRDDEPDTSRYSLRIQGSGRDCHRQGEGFFIPVDICVGRTISGDPKRNRSGIVEIDSSEIEKIFNEVRQDIPDAELLFSYQTHSYYSRATHP